MASSTSTLENREISQVTEIVSAHNRFRFSIEYLGINPNEYRTIESEAQFIHHDTLFECITRWKNRTEAEGNNAKDELIKILTQIRKEHGWFPYNDMAFLSDVMGIKIQESRLKEIQNWTKQSLKRRLQKSLSNDWIHESVSHKFPLRQCYVQLEWEKKTRTPMRSETVTLMSIHDLLKHLQLSEPESDISDTGASPTTLAGSSVIIEGEGGIGKTSSLGLLALDWAEDARTELLPFQFVFVILLRHVEGNESLEHIVMQQHGRLETMGVSPSEVKAILKGETEGNILLIFDGYDEYTKGSNEDIDKILLNGRENLLTILSSRSGDFLEQIRSQTDEEVRITGFSYENIIKCAAQYLQSKKLCEEFLSQAEQAGIHRTYGGLLQVPIILLMACTVFRENKCLPSKKTLIFREVVKMCVSRTTLKTMGKSAGEIENLHELMIKLGMLAWTALTRENKQLLIYKKDVIAESAEILNLGLLFGEDIDATTEELPAVLSFQHKLIQEYMAAVYIAENVKTDTAETFLEKLFPTWEKIQTHQEVVLFSCGLLAATDTSPVCITNYVGKVLAKNIHRKLDARGEGGLNMLQSCEKEGGISAVNPFVSQYPACGHPLAEVLANTKLACITDVDENDTLELNPSSAEIFLQLYIDIEGEGWIGIHDNVYNGEYYRLWKALNLTHANIAVLDLGRLRSEFSTKLHNFPQLRSLTLFECDYTEAEMEDLAGGIDSWGPQSELIHCNLDGMRGLPIPNSLMSALGKCTNLSTLTFTFCDLNDKLSALMVSPLPALSRLILSNCSLHDADVDHIAQAVIKGRLAKLEYLNIGEDLVGMGGNSVSEEGVGSLLEALVSIRPHREFHLELDSMGQLLDLSEQFEDEWKTKLKNTSITVGRWTKF